MTGRNAAIVGMAWGLPFMVGLMLPKAWVRVFKLHVVPAMMLTTCSVSVWVSGLRPGLTDDQKANGIVEMVAGTGIDGTETGFRVCLGIVLAVFAWLLPVVGRILIEKYLPEKVARQLRKVLL